MTGHNGFTYFHIVPITATCADDPDGALAANGILCDHIVGFGCSTDLHAAYPATFEADTLISSLCPNSCLSCVAPTHTFEFIDTHADGWHGGWWQLNDGCGVMIGGGPTDGQVNGTGGSYAFNESDPRRQKRSVLTARLGGSLSLFPQVPPSVMLAHRGESTLLTAQALALAAQD